jgi:transcriptional regulator with XRE-family HTH domain
MKNSRKIVARKQLTTRKQLNNVRRMSISDGIRLAIQRSGASNYTLARVSGIDQAALSRFANGKGLLSLDSIDKLANVLGLELIQTVSQTPRPSARGRKQKELPMIALPDTKATLRELAKELAVDANENHFESRRGVWSLDVFGALVVYNNHPYSGDKSARPAETERLRAVLSREGYQEMSYAETDDGYTFAMLVDPGIDDPTEQELTERRDKLSELYSGVVRETIETMRTK